MQKLFAQDTRPNQHRTLPVPPLSDKEAAELLGVAVQTMRNWRAQSRGPNYLKLSPGPRGWVVYLLEDLQDYMDSCRVEIRDCVHH